MTDTEAPTGFPADGTPEQKLRYLLRFAALAPSSHNTQPWRFKLSGNRIEICAAESGWLRVADADQRELYVSIGCALENLLIAARHFGYSCAVSYSREPSPDAAPAVVVELAPVPTAGDDRDGLFEAIATRSTNHKPYRDSQVSQENVAALRAFVTENDVDLLLTGDPAVRAELVALVRRADEIQFADPAWRRELAYWVGKGVFGTSWLVSKASRLMIPFLNLGKSQGDRDAKLLQSAPLLGIITTAGNDRELQITAGQVLERVWLKATALGISLHPMNQVLQVPELKRECAEVLSLTDQVPQLMFRLGYADHERKRSPRRTVGELSA